MEKMRKSWREEGREKILRRAQRGEVIKSRRRERERERATETE